MAYDAARRQKRRSTVEAGDVTVEDVRKVQGRRVCFYCGVGVELCAPRWHPCKTTVDHVMPLARGGTHHAENLVTACSQCNCAKGDFTAEEFFERIRNGCLTAC